jgi:hypothetical protein
MVHPTALWKRDLSANKGLLLPPPHGRLGRMRGSIGGIKVRIKRQAKREKYL